MAIEISQLAALAGVITGSAGLAVSLLAYGRDKERLWVSLQADRRVQNSAVYDPQKLYCAAEVKNVGRRPVFIDMVAILFPDGRNALPDDYLLSSVSLKEGDAPKHYMMEQNLLEKFDEQWPAILVVVRTSAGYQYRSRFLGQRPKNGRDIYLVGRMWLRLKIRWRMRWAFRTRVLY